MDVLHTGLWIYFLLAKECDFNYLVVYKAVCLHYDALSPRNRRRLSVCDYYFLKSS